jgi:hypothetical protein
MAGGLALISNVLLSKTTNFNLGHVVPRRTFPVDDATMSDERRRPALLTYCWWNDHFHQAHSRH